MRTRGAPTRLEPHGDPCRLSNWGGLQGLVPPRSGGVTPYPDVDVPCFWRGGCDKHPSSWRSTLSAGIFAVDSTLYYTTTYRIESPQRRELIRQALLAEVRDCTFSTGAD